MTKPRYKTLTRTQGNNRALKEGIVTPSGFEFEFEEIPVLVHGFRRMVRNLEFDISEMALTTYVCAREHGVAFTALPIFLVRNFHHGAIVYNTEAGIRGPKDLEGRKVGVNRGYTVTTGVWARAILQDEHGVDLDRVTWMLSGDEHVERYRQPANVQPIDPGQDLASMLIDGEIAAAIGVDVDHPRVRGLIDEPAEAALRALRDRGLYPINHLIVVRSELLDANPDLARDLFDTFSRSKALYLEQLRAGRIAEPTAIDRVHLRVMEVQDDPLPYGIEPNRGVLEQLLRHAGTQKIITRPVAVEDLFDHGSLDLTG